MKRKLSLLLNIIIIVLEIIGLVVLYIDSGILYEYYTVDSNILCLITSVIFVLYLLCKKNIPKWLSILKFGSTISLTMTFIVVLFILAPMYDFNYKFLLFENSMLYQHLLCPILSIITFSFFDSLGEYNKKDIIKGLIFTIIYSVVLITLNILDIVVGPYPFLMIKKQSILVDIIWLISLLGLSYILAYTLKRLYVKYNK